MVKTNYVKRRPYRRVKYTKRKSVGRNADAIAGIQRSLRSDKNQYGLSHETRSSALTDTVVPIFPAAVASTYSPAWSNWGPNSSIAQSAGRVTVPSVHVNMQFTAYNQSPPVTVSMFHIKLVPMGANDIIGDLTRDLGGVGAFSANEYITRGAFSATVGLAQTNGHPRLNPRYFEIKKSWQFVLGGQTANTLATPVTNIHDNIKNITYTVPMGNQVLGSPNDDWVLLNADAYKNENLNYFVIFSDNSSVGGSPSYSMNMSTIVTAKE